MGPALLTQGWALVPALAGTPMAQTLACFRPWAAAPSWGFWAWRPRTASRRRWMLPLAAWKLASIRQLGFAARVRPRAFSAARGERNKRFAARGGSVEHCAYFSDAVRSMPSRCPASRRPKFSQRSMRQATPVLALEAFPPTPCNRPTQPTHPRLVRRLRWPAAGGRREGLEGKRRRRLAHRPP